MTNLLIALHNLIQHPITDLITHYRTSNRANNMWDALETYVKDAFCNSFQVTNEEKDQLYSANFSYLGNQNNPPDIIIKRGDAIEVKKIESETSALALNSSYPKNKLYADDTRITQECKTCEDPDNWSEKDIIYTVGVAKNESLKVLGFVYGDLYCANREIYQRIANQISSGVQQIPDLEFTETNELGKVKKVDPLWITDLRIRGMWHIENPLKVFQDYIKIDNKNLTLYAIIPTDKYNSFPEVDRQKLEGITKIGFSIQDIQVKNPNNPAQLLDAKLIRYAE